MKSLFSDITQPIMQAPIGSACSVDLALAVTNAGGIGSLAFTWDSPGSVSNTVAFMNQHSNGLYVANYVLDLALYAGTSATQINDVLPAATIDKQLCSKLPKTL